MFILLRGLMRMLFFCKKVICVKHLDCPSLDYALIYFFSIDAV